MKKLVVYVALLSLVLSSCNSDYSLYMIACDESSEGVQETATPVTLNGKYVGDVNNFLSTKAGVAIWIIINDGLKIPANSKFIIEGVGSNKQITIQPGSSKMYLRDNDTIRCSSPSAINFNKIPRIYGCNK